MVEYYNERSPVIYMRAHMRGILLSGPFKLLMIRYERCVTHICPCQ
jgi:hypothetical protein